MMMRDLHTPWSDEITLIWREKTQAESGYETITEHESDPPLLCDFENGVSQSEYYQSQKTGMAASAQAEVQTVDYLEFWPSGYTDHRYAELNGTRYQILRSFPQSFDTMTLMLAEVVR